MTNQQKYTSVPWVHERKTGFFYQRVSNSTIGNTLSDKDAEFICRAVNSHEALLEACRQVALYARVGHDKPKDYGEVVAKAIELAEGKTDDK